GGHQGGLRQGKGGHRAAKAVANGAREIARASTVMSAPVPFRGLIGYVRALSMIAATPIPPAVQIEIRPRPPFSPSSFASNAAMRPPVAAKGWPTARDEPFTLIFVRSIAPSGDSLPRRALQ